MGTEDDKTAELLDMLYGDGAWEISKALTDRNKRRLTAGLSAVGAGAGALGLAVGGKAIIRDGWKATPRLTRALVPAEVAGLGGELMATKILHGDTKKKPAKVMKPVKTPTTFNKGFFKPKAPPAPPTPEQPQQAKTPVKIKLAKKGVDVASVGAKQAPKVAGTAMAKVNQMADPQRTVTTVKKDVEFEIKGEVSKMLTDKKQVFGWASVIELNGEPVIDLQGDVMTIDTIEKAAYNYVHNSRKGGRQHQRDGELPLHVSDMIESFVMTPEKKEAMGLGPEVPTGWWVGFQVNDEDTWAAYKDGKLKEFSIHGSGTRKALEV